MREIGIRELKRQASEIVRTVREERVEYVITHRGKPVAMIVPFEEPHEVAAQERQMLQEFWADMDTLVQEMEATTPPDAKSPLQQLFEDREDS